MIWDLQVLINRDGEFRCKSKVKIKIKRILILKIYF